MNKDKTKLRIYIAMDIVVITMCIILYFYFVYQPPPPPPPPPVHGYLDFRYYDEKNNSAVFYIYLWRPTKFILNQTKIIVALMNESSGSAFRTNNYKIIDSDSNGYINTGDFLIVYNASKYIGWEVTMSFSGWSGTLNGVIKYYET